MRPARLYPAFAAVVLLLIALLASRRDQLPALLPAPASPAIKGPAAATIASAVPARDTRGAAFVASVGASAARREALARTQAFDDWLLAWRRSSASSHALLAGRGRELAAARRDALAYLIQTDPQRALQVAVHPGVRRELPADVRDLLEEQIDTQGRLDVTLRCFDPAAGPRDEIERVVQGDGRRWHAHVFGRRETQTSQQSLPIHGIALGTELAFSDQPYRVIETAEENYTPADGEFAVRVGKQIVRVASPGALAQLRAGLVAAESGVGPLMPDTAAAVPVGWNVGSKRLLVIRADFPDAAGETVSDAQINTSVAAASAFYQDVTNGLASLSVTILPGVYRLPNSRAYYVDTPFALSDVGTDVTKRALDYDVANGGTGVYDPNRADRWLVVFPKLPATGYAGVGTIGGRGIWMNGNFDAGTVAHELGHNNGVYHSHSWHVSTGAPFATTGEHVEYGDIYDVMGQRPELTNAHFNTAQKEILGYLPAAAITSVADNGTFRLYRHDHRDASGIRALKIPSLTYDYWLEYRRAAPANFSATQTTALQNSVQLRWGNRPYFAPGYGIYLLDMNPDLPGDMSDAGLAIGRTYTDTEAGITITPLATGGAAPNEYIDVKVEFGGLNGNRNPVIASTAPGTSLVARTDVNFAATATDADGDTIQYRWDFGDKRTNPQTATQSHRWLKGGAYTVSAVAIDGKGGRSAVSYPVTVTDPFLTWTQRAREISSSQSFLAGVYGGGRFVFAGSNGLIAASADGINWTAATSPAPSLTVRGVAYNGTRYVAVGDHGSSPNALASVDGIVWQTTPMPGAPSLQAVAASSTRFVAVGANGRIMTSADGLAWSEATSPVTDQLYDIAYAAGQFVAVGVAGRVITSVDGLTWANHTLPVPHILHAVARAGNLWYATPGSYVWTSPDAITWTQQDTTPNTNVFRMASTTAGTLVAPTSVGEVTWTEGTLPWEKLTIDPARALDNHTPIATGNGLVVIGGGEGRLYTAGTPTLAAPLLRDLRPVPEVQAGRANTVAVSGQTYTHLELLVDNQKVAENDGSTALTWTPARFGTYQVAARGTVAGGATATSNAETIKSIYSEWNWSAPLPFDVALYGGVRANDRWYLAGGAGGLFSVDDAGNATRVNLRSNEKFTGIAYANGRFVATSDGFDRARNVAGSGVWSSSDGVTWIPLPETSGLPMYAVTYGPGLWVAVGPSRIFTSPDGINWTSRTAPNLASTQVYAIAYGGGQWVAAGNNGTILTSPDAVTWTSRVSGSTQFLLSAAYVNGHWVVAGFGGELWHSTDAVTWTRVGPTVNEDYHAVARVRDAFVAVSASGSVLVSPTGLSWTAATKPVGQLSFTGIATDGTNSLLLTLAGSYFTSTAAANTWTRPGNLVTAATRRSVAYGNGRFVAVGTGLDVETLAAASPISISTDGASWTSAFSTGNDIIELWGVTWNGQLFVAVGSFGYIYTSPDGVTWTVRNSGSSSVPVEFRGVAATTNSYVVVGFGGAIYSSSTGITWTPRTSGTTASLRSVTYGPSGYIAVGDGGVILGSADGVTWTPRSAGVTTDFGVVATVEGMGYVAAGRGGTVLVSSNGTTWTTRDLGLGTNEELASITDTPQGAMVTYGRDGLIAFSGNGTTWIRGALPTDRLMTSFAVGPTSIVGVGERGLYLVQARGQRIIAATPTSRDTTAGGTTTFNAGAVAIADASYQWQRNGTDLAGAISPNLALGNIQPASTGIYTATATSGAQTLTTSPAILGVITSSKVIGTGSEIAANVQHANGNIFDQILLDGAAATFTADAAQNQITRLSYVDLTNDIVQVEFSGAGSVSIVLDAPTGPATAVNYNQPNVSYMKGHAGIVVAGANETTNLSVFSVGRANAVNQALFKDNVTYDGIADIAFVAISSTNGKFGGLRTSNANYFATKGVTGVYAPGVDFTGPVFVGDINAQDNARPYFVIGSSTDVRLTGGDLLQANGRAVVVAGITRLVFTAGGTSHGGNLPAQLNRARLEQDGTDVTAQIVVNPTP
jgi:hypothetical protein